MPDTHDKKPQKAPDTPQVKASRDKPSAASATVEAETIAAGAPRRTQGQGDVLDDRASHASQAAQGRRRDESGRFATDDDTREPSRASRSRSRPDDDYRAHYAYEDGQRRPSIRRDYNDYDTRDRGQRNLFEDQDDYRRREHQPSRDEDQRNHWVGQGYYGSGPSRDDYQRDSRNYGDDYRRYSSQERRPERYDDRRGWTQTDESRYGDYRDDRRPSWALQGDQQRHRDWERDDRGGYTSRRDYDDDYTRLQRGDRYHDDYDRRPVQDRYRDERPREYAEREDRTRYQYNDYHPVDRERSWQEVRHDAGYVPRRGRRDDR
jgi:hypothetical protein